MIIGNIEIKRYSGREVNKYLKTVFGDKLLLCAEIGVWEGKNAHEMINMLNIQKIYLIDSYAKYDEFASYEGDFVDKAKSKAFKRLKPYENKIKWLICKASVAKDLINEKLDYVYIDGNHQYKYVLEDMENYYPLLKDEGILCGHDIFQPEVIRAVWDFCEKHNKKFIVRGDNWIIHKSGEAI